MTFLIRKDITDRLSTACVLVTGTLRGGFQARGYFNNLTDAYLHATKVLHLQINDANWFTIPLRHGEWVPGFDALSEYSVEKHKANFPKQEKD